MIEILLGNSPRCQLGKNSTLMIAHEWGWATSG